jgi:hypothetical protein
MSQVREPSVPVSAEVDVRIAERIGRPIPHAHVGTRMRRVLRRLPSAPIRADVTFRDVNGPKGGNDICCAVLLALPRQPAIRIERLGRTPRLAFDAAYERVVRQVEQYRERWQNSRRRPKKYYTAKRLLRPAE